LSCEYLREFSKKFETVLMGYSGAGGKLIDEKKTRSEKSRDTVPLRLGQFCRYPMGRRIAAVDPALCDPCMTRSRVGTHRSGAQYQRDAFFKGRNIQELSVGDTSKGCNVISSPTDVSPKKKSLMFRPLDNASLVQWVPWSPPPMAQASPRPRVPGGYVPTLLGQTDLMLGTGRVGL
jgi:hypothetical protein